MDFMNPSQQHQDVRLGTQFREHTQNLHPQGHVMDMKTKDPEEMEEYPKLNMRVNAQLVSVNGEQYIIEYLILNNHIVFHVQVPQYQTESQTLKHHIVSHVTIPRCL